MFDCYWKITVIPTNGIFYFLLLVNGTEVLLGFVFKSTYKAKKRLFTFASSNRSFLFALSCESKPLSSNIFISFHSTLCVPYTDIYTYDLCHTNILLLNANLSSRLAKTVSSGLRTARSKNTAVNSWGGNRNNRKIDCERLAALYLVGEKP